MALLSRFAMSDNSSRSDGDKSSSDLDLSSLGELSLGPSWGSGSLPSSKSPKWSEDKGAQRGRRDRRGGETPGGSRDRRGGKTARTSGSGSGGHGRDERSHRGEGHRRGAPHGRSRDARSERPFQPIIEADFYPDDNAFKALTQAIRQSFRTFELFEIARLILEKPERWVCVAKHPDQKEGEPAILHAAVPDGLPFLSEQAAIDHVLKFHVEEFFEIEAYEAEAPSGSFQMVHKCGFTSEIIGPPNFHRYQAMLREHQAKHLPHLTLERVQARLESVREQEAIDAWLEKMKQGKRYTLKDQPAEAAPVVLEDLESVRLYLLTNLKEKVVRPAYSVRFLGRDLTNLPENDTLRRSIETHYAQQMRFPLTTANNLRGRLRRLNLAVYKRGSKGVSYVCAVKRNFRSKDEVLAENLSNLIEFIEAHPNLKATDLPREYLGITEPGATVESAESVESVDGTSSPETAEDGGEGSPKEPEVAVDGAQDELKVLGRDLRYLISQGYVIEYSDGRLEVPPVKEEPKVEKAAETSKTAGKAVVPSPAAAPQAEVSEPVPEAATTGPGSVEASVPVDSVAPGELPAEEKASEEKQSPQTPPADASKPEKKISNEEEPELF